MTYVLTGKGSVIGARSRKIFKGKGKEMPEDEIGSNLDLLLKNKTLVKKPEHPSLDDIIEKATGGEEKSKLVEVIPPPPAPKDVKVASEWAEDPTKLAGMTLGDLNRKALSIDPTIEPFETVEEAIACLSRDFKAAPRRGKK